MIYWDTSVILKLYVDEDDSLNWQRLAVQEKTRLRTSALAFVEMAHALKQKERRGEISSGAAQHLFPLFKEDVDEGRFLLFPLGRDVLARCTETALEGSPLRTLDGLHLSTANLARCTRIATADERLAEAATSQGLEVVSLDGI